MCLQTVNIHQFFAMALGLTSHTSLQLMHHILHILGPFSPSTTLCPSFPLCSLTTSEEAMSGDIMEIWGGCGESNGFGGDGVDEDDSDDIAIPLPGLSPHLVLPLWVSIIVQGFQSDSLKSSSVGSLDVSSPVCSSPEDPWRAFPNGFSCRHWYWFSIMGMLHSIKLSALSSCVMSPGGKSWKLAEFTSFSVISSFVGSLRVGKLVYFFKRKVFFSFFFLLLHLKYFFRLILLVLHSRFPYKKL